MEKPIKLSAFKLFLFELFDLIAYVVFVAGIVFFIRFFVINPFNVVGNSMHPTIYDGDMILVDKISKRIENYKRGDIIVFLPPGKKNHYVKRIIGLPGETITIKENTVTACDTKQGDCKVLDQSFLGDIQTTASCSKDTFVVEDGFFVLGDNRGGSTDSRCCFGLQCFSGSNFTVPDNHIIGKVLLRVGNFGVFKKQLAGEDIQYDHFSTFNNPYYISDDSNTI